MRNTISIIDLLEQTFQLYPNKDYMFDGERTISYRQLYQESCLLASGLNILGVSKGDRVLVCLPNCHEFVAIFFGLARIGAIMIPCNPCYQKEDIQPILEDGEVKAVFLSDKEHLINVFRDNKIEIIVTVRYEEPGCFSYKSLLTIGESAVNDPSVPIHPESDVMVILYSSGTTGKPKGVMLTHRNLLYEAKTAKYQLECTETDIIFTPVPVFHVFGLVPGILLTILTGAKMILMEKFNKIKALQLIEKGQATIHLGVPTMFILELNKMKEIDCDLSSLRTGIIAGSPCPSHIVRMIRKQMGCNIKISYGMTETASAVTFTSFTDDDRVCSETVGKAIPGTEIKIVDENRKEVPFGVIGELACRGIGVMKGYYNMPEKTKEVIDHDGWYYSGDLATLNEEGYCSIVGRKKDMITRGGYNIYPCEVEEILFRHPSVLDAAIVGVPNPVLGEVSCAFIKLKSDSVESEGSIKSFLVNKVVKYKIPDRILFLDELPINANGKILKSKLREIAMEQEGSYYKLNN
nr:class I adenylate-forming enzyme family protein [uncultured Bacillus sp.]